MIRLRIFCVILILIAGVTSDDHPPDLNEGPPEETPASDEVTESTEDEGGQPNEGDGDDATSSPDENPPEQSPPPDESPPEEAVLPNKISHEAAHRANEEPEPTTEGKQPTSGETDPGMKMPETPGTIPLPHFVTVPCRYLPIYTDNLVRLTPKGYGFRDSCNGVLVEPAFVLTSVSCHHQILQISKIVIQIVADTVFQFNSEIETMEILGDDLALIKLRRSVPTDLHITYAKLPGQNLSENIADYCTDVLFAGWGYIPKATQNTKCNPKLMCAYLPIKSSVNGKTCTELLNVPKGKFDMPSNNENVFYCSLENSSIPSSPVCQYERGGGAFCVKTNELIGIMTYVSENCKGLIFTRVDIYKDILRRGGFTIIERERSKGSRLDLDISLLLLIIAMKILVIDIFM